MHQKLTGNHEEQVRSPKISTLVTHHVSVQAGSTEVAPVSSTVVDKEQPLVQAKSGRRKACSQKESATPKAQASLGVKHEKEEAGNEDGEVKCEKVWCSCHAYLAFDERADR